MSLFILFVPCTFQAMWGIWNAEMWSNCFILLIPSAKEEPLLASSAEVVYHTLNCSALNVEELRREKGISDLIINFFIFCAIFYAWSPSYDIPIENNND